MVLIDDRYELVGGGPLGRGRFGEVWEARDKNLGGKRVGLKLYFPNALPPQIRRALAYREATFLTKLGGPNILQVFNADTDEARDLPYVAMQLAPGGSAEDQLEKNPRGILPSIVSAWMRGALVGLSACHTARVLHGDIKPANVFVYRHDVAKLGDLGLAQQMDNAGRAPAAGDLLVQAPEALTSGYATERSDIYAVGVSVYRLLTGHWPFEHPNPTTLAHLIANTNPRRVRDIAPHVSPGLARVVERAMAPNAGSRFSDAQELLSALSTQSSFRRIWLPHAHAGHLQCWTEARRVASHSVCLLQVDGRLSVSVTHGAAGRVRRLCRTSMSAGESRTHLRRVFRELGC